MITIQPPGGDNRLSSCRLPALYEIGSQMLLNGRVSAGGMILARVVSLQKRFTQRERGRESGRARRGDSSLRRSAPRRNTQFSKSIRRL
jgi:hypothetical protein